MRSLRSRRKGAHHHWAAIASFVLAGVMATLVAFGVWHAHRTPKDEELAMHRDELTIRNEETNGTSHVKELEPVNV
jgi:hypothetical protein